MSNIIEEDELRSSSSSSERFTIAYSETPAIARSDSEGTGSSDYTSTSSTSLETPHSEQSFTSLFDNITHAKKQAEFFGYEPRRSAASLHDGPQLDGLEYLWSHNIFQLFCFLMSHLLAHTPDEPLAFLARLVNRCLLYRDRGADPPLLFEEPHVRSIFTALDPGGDGSIRYAQYVTGMKTLGLFDFNLLPGEVDYLGKDVEEELFINEARQALLQQLDSILGCSSPAVISRDLVADYRGSQTEGCSASASDDRSAHTVEDAKDRSSKGIMTDFNATHGGGMPGLMSSHSMAGRSAFSSKNLVTKYMREQDQDMTGFVSSHSITNEGETTQLKTEFVEQKGELAGIKSGHTIGSTQRSSRELEKVQSYDLAKSEVVQEMMSSSTIRVAEGVGPSRISEKSALGGALAQPSNVSLRTSKQNTLRSGGESNVVAPSKEQLVG